MIKPASPKAPDNPIPAHMITGNRADRDIKAGELITYGMVEDRSDTTLWRLRARQDREFGL